MESRNIQPADAGQLTKARLALNTSLSALAILVDYEFVKDQARYEIIDWNGRFANRKRQAGNESVMSDRRTKKVGVGLLCYRCT